jgi:hypothetical protein
MPRGCQATKTGPPDLRRNHCSFLVLSHLEAPRLVADLELVGGGLGTRAPRWFQVVRRSPLHAAMMPVGESEGRITDFERHVAWSKGNAGALADRGTGGDPTTDRSVN